MSIQFSIETDFGKMFVFYHDAETGKIIKSNKNSKEKDVNKIKQIKILLYDYYVIVVMIIIRLWDVNYYIVYY